MKPFRFSAVISHPIQHYSPVFRELARIPGVEVRVFYLCDHGVRESFDPGFGQAFKWDVPLLDGYDYEFLRPGYSPPDAGLLRLDSPRLAGRLDAFRPHAIWTHGYGQAISWRALLWAKRNGAAVVYFGDSELLHARSLRARAVKRLVLPWFFRCCDAFITIGDNNEAYYRHYGVPEGRMYRGGCPVETARFTAARERLDTAQRQAMRARYGLPADAFVVALSGKLVPWKRPLDLVEAVARCGHVTRPVAALFVGDGPMRGEVEGRIQALGLESHCRVSGFVNQKDIADVLLAADVLAVTSERDAHPLSVTESLALGHPIIASDRVGCVGPTDTARPGVNALVYPCSDVDALARAIGALASDEALYRRMSLASLELVPIGDVGYTVAGVVRALCALREGRFAAAWNDLSLPCTGLPTGGGKQELDRLNRISG